MADPNTPAPPTSAEVEAQLARLKRGAAFAASERLSVFLDFVVRETLAGRGARLKESVIGDAVYARAEGYDPRLDSTVRVEARRLRRKLAEHFAGEGADDPVRVALPVGTYVPTFERRVGARGEAARADRADAAAQPIFGDGDGAALAILPFRALSSHPDDALFADGLTDELIYALSRAAGLRVVSRAIAFQYKDRAYAPSVAARELEVDVVMQGTVRRRGSEIRVTVDLSDPAGFVVCSDRFDAPADDPGRLQEQIAATLESRTRMDSSTIRARRIGPASPRALQANATIYRARQLLDQQTPAAIADALRLFTEVAAAAPDYGRGYSGIADATCDRFRLGLIDAAAARRTAHAAVERALAIDPDSVEAHTAAATVAAWLDRDAVGAEAKLEMALSLGGTARAARIYGVFLALWARTKESDLWLARARALEPFSSQQDIAESLSHFQARRLEPLLAAMPPAMERRLPLEAAYLRALAHARDGDGAVADRIAARLESEAIGQPTLAYAVEEIAAWQGRRAGAVRALASPSRAASGYARAMLAAAAGNAAACESALRAAVAAGEIATAWLRTDARLDGFRGEAWLRALIERLDAAAFGRGDAGTHRESDELTSTRAGRAPRSTT